MYVIYIVFCICFFTVFFVYFDNFKLFVYYIICRYLYSYILKRFVSTGIVKVGGYMHIAYIQTYSIYVLLLLRNIVRIYLYLITFVYIIYTQNVHLKYSKEYSILLGVHIQYHSRRPFYPKGFQSVIINFIYFFNHSKCLIV